MGSRVLPLLIRLSLLRDYFEPVIVRIIDKVNSHGFVFKADATHFFMQGMSGDKIIHLKSQMEFVISQIVRLFSVFEPGELQLMRRLAIAQKDDNETSIRSLN